MIEVKKILSKFVSSFIISFLILSNTVFAPSHPEFYEDKPIDESKGGKEHYKEGDIIVYPHKISSKEKEMMERFHSGDISEGEMRRMAKAKFGEDFPEEEFQSGMIDSKRMMERKDAFSYENEGYGSMYYHAGPSYEGYSKEHMIFGMVFEQIGDDIDPREIKKYCNETNKLADIIISKLKEKVGDIQKICDKMEEHEAKCSEDSKTDCSRIGTPFVMEGATEMKKIESIAYSCPPNKDAIIEACKKRGTFYMEQNIKNADEECEKRFDFEGDRLKKECERFKQSNVCDKEKFMDKCMGGIKKRDFEKKCGNNICEEGEDYYCPPCVNDKIHPCKMPCRVGTCQQDCEKPEEACPKDAKICPDGSVVGRVPPSCEFKSCPTTCPPPPSSPPCPEGTASKPTYDANGCVIGQRCEQIPCPEVVKPACNTGVELKAYYDNSGCVTSYQCIKQQPTCPEVQKPACGEGQSLTAKYDDRRCIVGYECITLTATTTSTSNATVATATGSAIRITGRAVSSESDYDDIERRCEKSWIHQQRICFDTPEICDKEAFIEKCTEMERRNNEDSLSRVSYHCESQTIAEIKHAEQRCERIEEDRQRCSDDSAERCEHMKGLSKECRKLLTEENLRKFIVEETKKRCKFTNIITDEDDLKKAEKVEVILAVLNTATKDDIEKLELFVESLKEELKLQDTTVYKGAIHPKSFGDIKLMPFVVNAKLSTVTSSKRAKEVKANIVARENAEGVASKLASLRDSDVPSQYLYIIEDKASEVLNVSEQLGEIEKKEERKGIGYKIKLFLGLAKAAEQQEIEQLQDSKSKLNNSIETLTALIDEVPSDVAKAVLKEQVENLKQQQAEIEVLVDTKEKKAKGLFGVFG